MNYNFDKIILRSNTRSLKYDTRERYVKAKDTIPIWVADMDFEAPPEVLEAIRQRAEHGIFGYNIRTDDYYDAVINWMRRRFAWEVKQSWITFIAGVVPALNFAVNSYLHQNFKFLASFVRDHLPQVKAIPLEGTYLVWLDFRGMARSDDEIKETLLNQAKVWLSDGSTFGKGGEGFQRINIATPRDVLESGLKQIAKAFADN